MVVDLASIAICCAAIVIWPVIVGLTVNPYGRPVDPAEAEAHVRAILRGWYLLILITVAVVVFT